MILFVIKDVHMRSQHGITVSLTVFNRTEKDFSHEGQFPPQEQNNNQNCAGRKQEVPETIEPGQEQETSCFSRKQSFPLVGQKGPCREVCSFFCTSCPAATHGKRNVRLEKGTNPTSREDREGITLKCPTYSNC